MFKKTVLDNGLRIITAPMQGTNTVTVLVLCGTGSDYESSEQGGISHFLEHMFFKGTARRPGPEIIAEELDQMGSIHNAFTSHEITGYFIKAGKGFLNQSLDILSDIYNNSFLKEEEVEKEKQVIVEEMHQDKDTPTTYVWWVWENILYGDQPAGRDVIGQEATVRGLKREDFVNYFFHQYVAANTAVVVAGNFDERASLELIKSSFLDIRHERPIRSKPPVSEPQATPAVAVSFKETDQTHMVIGFRGYDANHPRRYAADVLATLLGGGMSSRMFIEIRERLGLAYAVFTGHEAYSNRGYLTTYVGVDHRNVEKTLGATLKEYKRICDEPVSVRELSKVKDSIKGRTLIALEQSSAVANFVGVEELLTGQPLTVDEVFAKIDAVTAEDLAAVARELMRPEKLNLAMIGPFKDGDKFQKLLAEF